jgi:hypothetical protein
MAEKRPDWSERLRGIFAGLPGQSAAQPPSAPDDPAGLARDLAEERAAIMQFDGGLPRDQAEALAFRQHGLKPPRRQ